MIVLALIVWASWIAYTTRIIPDVPLYWLYLVLGLYGINKVMEGAKAIIPALKGVTNGPDQPAQ